MDPGFLLNTDSDPGLKLYVLEKCVTIFYPETVWFKTDITDRVPVSAIGADPNPQYFGKPDLHLHSMSKFRNCRGNRAVVGRGRLQWRVFRIVVAEMHHFDKEQDPNPHQLENDPDPHHSEMIRIRIIVK